MNGLKSKIKNDTIKTGDTMSKELMEFIQKHNIDIDSIYDELRIYSEGEINHIIANNRLNGGSSVEMVSIADIIGYQYDWRGLSNNIAKNFSGFFGRADEYHSRSIGMLSYSSDEIIEKLSPSFDKEPITILELDRGRKVISDNGLHRYTVLRLHYIHELNKVKGNKEKEEELRQKYTIPVEVTKVDLLKTYCQYIISFISLDAISLLNDYDDYYKPTGKVRACSSNETIILDDEQLLNYTKNIIRNIPENMVECFLNDIVMNCDKYASLNLFVNTYLTEEIALLSEKNSKKGRGGQ